MASFLSQLFPTFVPIKKIFYIFTAAVLCCSAGLPVSGIYTAQNSTVSFVSSANFEKIKARSTDLKGTLDIHKRTFSFTIPICSFQGFLNDTQKKHYCSKYVEGDKFPNATYKGKIIEEVDLTMPGVYNVRGKGTMNLHGVEKELIIKALVTVKDGQITIESKFTIPLEDHGMNISKTSTLVIAKVVDVEVKTTMVPE
jgi:hypothetical protein